jgi:hypothetical protein
VCNSRARPRPPELRSTTPAVARWCSFPLDGHHLPGVCRAADGQRSFSRAGQSRFHGSGAGRRPGGPRWLPPPRPLAVKALPQPNRLGHPLSQARDDPPPGDVDVVRSSHSRYGLASRPGARAPARPRDRCRGLCRIGPLHPPSREGERGPPHPRCLPSPDRPPFGGLVPTPQPVPSLWSAARRLFDLRPLPCP